MNIEDAEISLGAWLDRFLGGRLKRLQTTHLEHAVAGLRGRHVVQVGAMVGRLAAPHFERHTLVSSGGLPSDVHALPVDLPLASDSVEALVLPHAFDSGASPRDVLREAWRVVRPEGHLVLSGLAPISTLGVARSLRRRSTAMPWAGPWFTALRVLGWLEETGFERSAAARGRGVGPVPLTATRRTGGSLEPLARRALGVHIIVAQKRERRLTPLPQRWRPREVAVIGLAEAASARASVQQRDDKS